MLGIKPVIDCQARPNIVSCFRRFSQELAFADTVVALIATRVTLFRVGMSACGRIRNNSSAKIAGLPGTLWTIFY